MTTPSTAKRKASMSYMTEKFLTEQMTRNAAEVVSAAARDRGVDFASGVASGFEMRQIGVAIDSLAARAATGDMDGVDELKSAIGDMLSSICSRTVGSLPVADLEEALAASNDLFAAWELSNKAINLLDETLGSRKAVSVSAANVQSADEAQSAQPDAKPTVIKPTVGRRVWYWPSGFDRGVMAADGVQPCDAGIAYVWGDRMVNLTVADHDGLMHRRTSVVLVQDGDPTPTSGAYATWMPYQTAQAAKAEQPAEPAGIAVFLTEDPDHGDASDSYGGTIG